MATILVVDDDSVILELLIAVLEDESDHTVVAASNGSEALDRLREGHVDAVVCDVNMPIMDGIEFVRTVRADPALQDLPVVLTSAVTDPAALDPELNVDLMLEKPFEVNALIACVSFVLERVRSGQRTVRVTTRRASDSVNRIMREHRRTTRFGRSAAT
jgi:CheY-like chemotaxis protein